MTIPNTPMSPGSKRPVEVSVRVDRGSFVRDAAPVLSGLATLLVGVALGVGILATAYKPPRPIDYYVDEEPGVAGLDTLRERAVEEHLVRGTAWKIDCGGGAHKTWACKAKDETKIIYRGGSDVATDGGLGLMYCDSATNANCVDDAIAGDSAHAWLETEADAGVDIVCVCGYQ